VGSSTRIHGRPRDGRGQATDFADVDLVKAPQAPDHRALASAISTRCKAFEAQQLVIRQRLMLPSFRISEAAGQADHTGLWDAPMTMRRRKSE